MSEQKKAPEQTGDNPNKDGGARQNPGDLHAGDIRWVTPPPNMEERDGKLQPKAGDGPKVKSLSKAQKRDLAGRIRAKLGLAASKRQG